MTKQTAVEFLLEEIECRGILTKELRIAFQQAKEIEKEQIANSFEIGYENGACVNDGESIYHGINYYNKTFKK